MVQEAAAMQHRAEKAGLQGLTMWLACPTIWRLNDTGHH